MNKRFLYLSFSFFLISLGLMLLSFSSYKPLKAAAPYTYNYAWNMTKCRTASYDGGANTKEVFLGPAEWTTTPLVLPDGRTSTETWTAGDWREFHNFPDSGPATLDFSHYSTKGITDASCSRMAASVPMPQYGFDSNFYTSGSSYGAVIAYFARFPDYHFAGTWSIPTRWTISGRIE